MIDFAFYCRAGNRISLDTLTAMWQLPKYREVAKDMLPQGDVVTAWVGIDHRPLHDSPGVPLIFETVVTGGVYDGETDYYATADEALAGHLRMVGRVLCLGLR